MQKTDIVIIGAGVLGLSIATALSRKGRNIIVIEKEKTFGQGSSSRNSEIIHSGIYYLKNSLKAKLCVEGRELLYEFCQQQGIPHKRIGKLIVATDNSEVEELEGLLKRGRDNGVDDLRLLDKDEIKDIELHIKAVAAISSPSTGIVDTHILMKKLEYLSESRGVVFAYNCEAIDIVKNKQGYQVDIVDADGERLALSTKTLINSAGLYSDKVAEMAGIDIDRYNYRLYHSKGEYFRLNQRKASLIKHLIYPTPESTSLGIHTVTDLKGQVKLGPNAFYIDEVNYDVDKSHKKEFYESARKYLPFLKSDDLSPDMSGIRAKLQAPGKPERDFIISEESEKGFSMLINLIGIESPGLTASLSIAKHIECMI